MKCDVEGQIDIAGFRAEVGQLWAEAVVIYKQMRDRETAPYLPLYLTDKKAVKEAEAMQESRRVETAEDVLAAQIKDWLDEPIGAQFEDLDSDTEPQYRNEVCGGQVWVEMMGGDRRQYDEKQVRLYGRALKLVSGWYSTQGRMPKYGKQRIYRREVWSGIP